MKKQTEIVRAYLEQHFVGAEINISEVPEEHGWGYKVSCEEGQFNLLVLDEAFEGLDDEQAVIQIETFQVADVMRNLEGFTITVTNSGCIFR